MKRWKTTLSKTFFLISCIQKRKLFGHTYKKSTQTKAGQIELQQAHLQKERKLRSYKGEAPITTAYYTLQNIKFGLHIMLEQLIMQVIIIFGSILIMVV